MKTDEKRNEMAMKISFQKYRAARVACWIGLLLVTACVGEEYPSSDTPEDNFEALWLLMDEHYCFFTYKQQTIGVDWDEVHSRYAAKISATMTDEQLFEVLCNMLSELQDGHVNLAAAYDLGRNWSYREDYADNFDTELCEAYLGSGSDYAIASSLYYTILDDNVAYVRCASFDDDIGDGNLSVMLNALAGCHGLILDVRDNSGGELSTARKLAARFTNTKTLVGYVSHKTGTGRDDFSTPEEEYISPSDGVRWQKRAVVLTNRSSYSATNDFVKAVQEFPLVTVLGDTTGGGSGMPYIQEIPNGWTVRYSAVVYYDARGEHIEFGIAPDVVCSLDSLDQLRGEDTLIEAARALILAEAAATEAE